MVIYLKAWMRIDRQKLPIDFLRILQDYLRGIFFIVLLRKVSNPQFFNPLPNEELIMSVSFFLFHL